MSGEAIQPCPFCGYDGRWEGKGAWRVVCTNVTCGAKGPSALYEAQAVIGWNHREPTPSQVLDAATVERCAIRDYLTACAAVADTQAERFAGHDASIVAACRAEAKAYLNAARMIEAQDHASRREQITAALATDPHQHGGKGA